MKFDLNYDPETRFVPIPEIEKYEKRHCFAWRYFYGSIEKGSKR